jgi:hypothetical protein
VGDGGRSIGHVYALEAELGDPQGRQQTPGELARVNLWLRLFRCRGGSDKGVDMDQSVAYLLFGPLWPFDLSAESRLI